MDEISILKTTLHVGTAICFFRRVRVANAFLEKESYYCFFDPHTLPGQLEYTTPILSLTPVLHNWPTNHRPVTQEGVHSSNSLQPTV